VPLFLHDKACSNEKNWNYTQLTLSVPEMTLTLLVFCFFWKSRKFASKWYTTLCI